MIAPAQKYTVLYGNAGNHGGTAAIAAANLDVAVHPRVSPRLAQDFTTGNLNRAIVLLAIPMVLEMVLESLFAVVDVFWVGRLGANAVATVGLTESLLSWSSPSALASACRQQRWSPAASARRIRRSGQRGSASDRHGPRRLASIGVPAASVRPTAALMGASPQIVSVGGGYARIALGGSGAIIMLFLNNAIFRGAGDAAIAMRLLWVSNIINLVLDPCSSSDSVHFPKLGVTGAALATLPDAASVCCTSSIAC